MQVSVKKAVNIMLVLFGFLLPIQAMFVYVFHLPSVVQMIYPFIAIGAGICFFIPLKKIGRSLDKNFIILFMLLLSAMFVSVVANYDEIMSHGMTFTYILEHYSKFWDRPDIRVFNWGILRPFLFFLYILILFIFLNFKDAVKLLLKTLIVLAVISAAYSVYQIIAAWFNLPFGSLFSGHSGNEIYLFGKLRRPEGVFYEPGPQATFLSPIFCILLFQLFEKDCKKRLFFSKVGNIMFALIAFVLFFTFSPLGILTIILATPLCLIINRKNIHFKLTKKNLLKISVSFVIIVILGTFLMSFISKAADNFSISKYMIEKVLISTSSFDSPLVYSNPDSRSVRNYAGIQIFKDHKLFGCGPGGAITYFFKYTPFTRAIPIVDQQAIINTHIKMLCELGILGFTCYLLILLYPLFLYVMNYKKIKNNKSLISSLAAGYLMYIIISFQATLQFWMPYFWMMYVSLIVLIRKDKYGRKYIETK